jgi:GT2 family glycosyltransferase
VNAVDVTLVVVNYNGRELLEAALPSITAQTYGSARVAVVDDASSDDSVAYLRAEWPGIELVALPHNVGITAALNAAVRAANTELVALLNNDVELAPDWLERLVAAMRVHPRAVGVCGKLLQFHQRELLDGAGDAITWGSASFHRGAGERAEGQYEVPGEVFAVSAAAALYRRSAFDDVGFFDEDFVAYLEDVDWAFRARLSGYELRYVPAAVAYHMGSATTGHRPEFLALQRQNQLQLIAKNYPARKLFRYLPRIALFHLLWLAASARDGVLRTHFRGLAMGIRLLPAALRKRRLIQGGRAVEPAALEAVVDRRWIVRARR